jgi:hypothetical protein
MQLLFPPDWMFQFEWGDMAVNYFTAATGWAIMAAIRERQKLLWKERRALLKFGYRVD